jgi:CRISPR type IV-associated protein Csf2
MPKYTIDTLIRLTSPLHVTEPSDGYWNPYTENFTSGSAPGAERFPCARIPYMPLARSTEGGAEKSSGVRVPVFPSNSARGKLRRCAAALVYAALRARGEKISLELYHVLQCGAASASPDGSATVSETARAAKHPVAGLFGGGPKLVWGHLSVGIAYPVTPDTLGDQVPEQFEAHCVKGKLTHVAHITKVDDILRGTGNVPTIIENPEEAIAKWLAFLGASNKNKEKAVTGTDAKAATKAEDKAGDKKRHLATLAYKEFVIPGVTFHAAHIVDADLIGDAGMGLFILALIGMANEQRIGGGYRDGFGRFTMQAFGRVIGDGASSFDLITSSNGVYAPNMQDATAARCVQAWEEFSKTLTAANVASVFSLE